MDAAPTCACASTPALADSPDALTTASPALRRAFLEHRFGFTCGCPRCAGEACDADGAPVRPVRSGAGGKGAACKGAGGKGAAGEGTPRPRSADEALEALADGCGAAEAEAARAAHRPLVCGLSASGQTDGERRLIGLRLREHDTYEAALAATERFSELAAATLAPTHWQRHQVRSLRCLCLLRVPNKAVPCLLLVAEHMAAEMQLLPKGHLLRLAAYRQFRAALGACPPAIRPRLVERARDTHGALDLRWLEHVQGWLRQEPLGAVAQPR